MSNQNVHGAKKVHRVAMRKVGLQFDDTKFEHRLVRAILQRAVVDLGSKHHRASALSFLRGPMRLVELCNVEPQWVRETLARCGVGLD